MARIKFNEPFMTGKEMHYMQEVMAAGHYSGNGDFTKRCQTFCEDKWHLGTCFLTHSGTGALEMAALLLDIEPGDEVIIPSYTFPSTALAFQRQGAKIVFVDSKETHPCLDETKIEGLITSRTKAIVPVHYGGVACDMDEIMRIANKHNVIVIEDAAHAIGGEYKQKSLGGIGHMGCFSFHESKNIHCGEGGMLILNEDRFIERAAIIWEKGTNKMAFLNGKVDKYECVDIGSSFLASDLLASFLLTQLEHFDQLNDHRQQIWDTYFQSLSGYPGVACPYIPAYASHNYHIFYVLTKNQEERDRLIAGLRSKAISAPFHYQSLHTSPFFRESNETLDLPNSDAYSNRLVRLPIHFNLSVSEAEYVAQTIKEIL
ncbi:MAG: dTDP-4-amino-4,6-dideoxygalactose transaminase [Bacteroidota bacterium]